MNDFTLTADQPTETAERNWLNYLPMLLRGIGAIAILISMYSFLAKGWDASSDMVRYLFLLGHTVALTAIGLTSAKVIKEAKGARLLLMLALVSVPVNFAILGAFVFSSSHHGALTQYPHYVTWTIDSLSSALSLSVAAIVLLVPICLIGFKVLVRNINRQSTVFFMISNLLLLLPFRDAGMVAVAALIAGGCLFAFQHMLLRKDLSFKTIEGKVAFALQFLPILILLGRSFWLYSIDAILVSCSALIVFFACRQIILSLSERASLRIILEAVSIALVLVCSATFGVALLAANLPQELIISLSTLIAASLAFEMSRYGRARASSYRVFATIIAVTGLMINFTMFQGLLSSLILLTIGAAMMVSSFVFQQKSLFIGSLVLITVGLFYQFTHLFTFFEFNYWLALVALGILSIVSGSYLEANAPRIKQWLLNNKRRMNEWEI